MKRILSSIIFLLTFLVLVLLSSSAAQAAWYKGNTHNHINNPTTYRNSYRDAGYHFITLGDHDTNFSCSDQESYSTSDFLVICGSELSDFDHLLAFGTNTLITSYSNFQDAVNKTTAAGGVSIRNHPSSGWAAEFLSYNNLNHFELANGKRLDNIPGLEIFWDEVLSAPNGRPAYAVGADDNHSGSPFGKAWIMVQANNLTKQEIVSNFRDGNFYASTGVNLSDYQVDYSAKTISIGSGGNKIEFIGKNGAALKTVSGSQATYQADGTEKYVRVKVTNSSGKAAWTQPVYFTGGPPPTNTPGAPTSTPTSPPSSPTPTPTPPSGPKNPDINNDGQVNQADMRQLLAVWGSSSAAEDLDSNGKVNSLDAGVIVAHWTGGGGASPTPTNWLIGSSDSYTPTKFWKLWRWWV